MKRMGPAMGSYTVAGPFLSHSLQQPLQGIPAGLLAPRGEVHFVTYGVEGWSRVLVAVNDLFLADGREASEGRTAPIAGAGHSQS